MPMFLQTITDILRDRESLNRALIRHVAAIGGREVEIAWPGKHPL